MKYMNFIIVGIFIAEAKSLSKLSKMVCIILQGYSEEKIKRIIL